MYENDLFSLDSEGSTFGFADNITILNDDINKPNLIHKATNFVSIIKNWLNVNSLEINLNRPCYIPFPLLLVRSLQIIIFDNYIFK